MSTLAEFRTLYDEIMRLLANGQSQAASARLDRARAERPDDPGPPTVLGTALSLIGQRADAVAAFTRALEFDPAFAPALYYRGIELQALGDLHGAAADFEKSAEMAPDYAEPLAQLADIAARRGDAEATRAFAGRTAALDPGEPISTLAFIAADLIVRDFTAAEAGARAALASGRLSPHNRAIALGQLGDALDGLGRRPEAFAAWSTSNEGLKSHYAPMFERPEEHTPLGHARRLLTYFEKADAQPWATRAADGPTHGPASGHAFIVGYPRSGTTLLEQVLASHPDVVALEERSCLEDSLTDLFLDAKALDRLSKARSDDLQAYRAAYWRRVANDGVDVHGKVFIDKMPLNTVLLPLIHKLFPDARILFAIRDPRDVVLSCFRRRFGMNPAMYQMLTLRGAAEYYDVVMKLGARFREIMPLKVRECRYEALVEDFETEARQHAAFLGLDWSGAMADFAKTARTRPVNTPSSTQVTRGLFREGMGQWKAYADQLTPVAPRLAPWVERFGYEA
ncbi:MAG: sulfotransferase [Caulobacteraceae bacterium]|nr:sulfotransferase [Caulobacteraceae bacterium]